MIKQIYTTGQAIQNELNRLYPKEHENFINDYTDFTSDERDMDWFIITVERLKGYIQYIQEEINEGYNDREGIKLMFERVIQIMQTHNIYKVNLIDENECTATLANADVKDIADYNARNVNHIEVKNWLCYLPERAKELINKHILIMLRQRASGLTKEILQECLKVMERRKKLRSILNVEVWTTFMETRHT